MHTSDFNPFNDDNTPTEAQSSMGITQSGIRLAKARFRQVQGPTSVAEQEAVKAVFNHFGVLSVLMGLIAHSEGNNSPEIAALLSHTFRDALEITAASASEELRTFGMPVEIWQMLQDADAEAGKPFVMDPNADA